MSKWSVIALTAIIFFVSATVTIAQTATTSFEPSPHVYKIVADCPDSSHQRIATGFRVKDQVGVVTALHTVVGCSSFSALSPSNGPGPFHNLIIAKVDIARDVALLWSEDLSKIAANGFEPITKPQDKDYAQVKVIGFPYDLYRQRPTVDLKVVETTELGNLLFPQVYEIFSARGSPGISIEVLSIQGALVPGHSGAPLLNAGNKVIGIANGGLYAGTTDMTWAIPWHMIDWKIVSSKVDTNVSDTAVKQLEKLAGVPSELFSTNIAAALTAIPSLTPPSPTVTPIPATSNVIANSLVRLQYDGIEASDEAGESRNAFDRNTTTLWAPYNKAIGVWVEVRFRNPKVVSRVGIFRDPKRTAGGQIVGFTLTFSNGSRQTSKIQGYNEWEYVDIQPVETTSVKLEVESIYPASNGVFVNEIELLGYDSPLAVTPTQTPQVTDTPQTANLSISPFRLQYDGIKVSDEYAARPAVNAFDRKLNTHWSNYEKAAGVWVELIFRSPKTVSRIRIYRGPEMFSWGQIQQATLVFSDGSRQSINLQGFDGWEEVDIQPILTTSVKLEIDSVHSGGNKLLVYEIEILGTE